MNEKIYQLTEEIEYYFDVNNYALNDELAPKTEYLLKLLNENNNIELQVLGEELMSLVYGHNEMPAKKYKKQIKKILNEIMKLTSVN